jgi:hypothetical protein
MSGPHGQPPGGEQRLILRVLAKYRTLCGADALPRRSLVDPRLFGRDWSHCLLIDIDPTLERSRFAHVGDALRDPSWPTLERQSLAECAENTLLHMATSYLGRIIARRLPISAGGIGIHDGIPIIYRSILMPLSESGGAIDGVLGAANYRDVPATEEVHPLREPASGTPIAQIGVAG